MWFNDEETIRCHGVWKVGYWRGAPLKDTSAKQALIEVCRDNTARGDSNKTLVDVARYVGSAENLGRKVIIGSLCEFTPEDFEQFIVSRLVKLLFTVRRGTG